MLAFMVGVLVGGHVGRGGGPRWIKVLHSWWALNVAERSFVHGVESWLGIPLIATGSLSAVLSMLGGAVASVTPRVASATAAAALGHT